MSGFKDERLSVTATDVLTGSSSYRLDSISGVSIEQLRGSYAGRWLGLMCVFLGLLYGGCASCADAMQGNHHGKLTGIGIFAFGLLAFAFGAWARGAYVVSINLGGQTVAVAAYSDMEKAKTAAEAIRGAVNSLGYQQR
jgi:hypothetical protein